MFQERARTRENTIYSPVMYTEACTTIVKSCFVKFVKFELSLLTQTTVTKDEKHTD